MQIVHKLKQNAVVFGFLFAGLLGMSTETIVPGADAPVREVVELPEGRSTRIAAGILLALLGVLLLVMAFTANPTGKIALSDAFAEVQLPTIEVSGPPVLLLFALLTLAAGAGFLSGRFPKNWRIAVGMVAGLSVLAGFMVWAASSSTVPGYARRRSWTPRR